MITGESGFTRRFADQYGYDQDVLTEYFMTISAINGIATEERDDQLTFSVSAKGLLYPLFVFADGKCSVFTAEIQNYGDSEMFLSDISCQNKSIPIPERTEDFDNTILAIYRYIHSL